MRRWTSVYQFEWTPIITFGVRRLRLLEWMEKNLDPVAFSDTPDHIGVALLNKMIRLVVHKSGMVLEDAVAAESGVSSLTPAVEGIWPVLEPKSVVLRSASLALSFDLEGIDYNEARAWFARQASGVDTWPYGFRAIDASALMDLEGPNYFAQVEWGIVSDTELEERLTEPREGRMSSNRPAASPSSVRVDQLPPTSLFVDLTIRADRSEVISDTAGIEAAIRFVDTVGTSIASSLRDIAVRETGKKI
jgi:hypothetical protein